MKYSLFLVICFLSSNVLAQTSGGLEKFASAAANVDWRCLSPKVPYPCADPAPGVYLRYWEPALVVETIKKGSHWQSTASSNIHVQEVNVYDFPTKLPEDAIACPSLPNVTGGIHYRSSMDPQWRSSVEANSFETKIDIKLPVGNWGTLHPRIGFMIAVSSAVSSALTSLRAVSISSMEPPYVGHNIIAPLDFMLDRTIDKMQMVYPYKSSCISPGEDSRFWAPGKESKDGSYLWVIWHYRECCKPITPP